MEKKRRRSPSEPTQENETQQSGEPRHNPKRKLKHPPSLMVRKFMYANENPSKFLSRTYKPPPPFQPTLFFFYGSLRSPETLAKVLDLEEPPELRPGRIYGYHCRKWGAYPALEAGKQDSVVHGVIFKVESEEQLKRLRQYVTYRYGDIFCNIKLPDDSYVDGRTFLWKYFYIDELSEGEFDFDNT